jgi:predicted RNA binding protein YcfA (HicA-like mRNA interferase family)
MSRTYRDVRRIPRNDGFVRVRTVGSHEYRAHPDGRRTSVAAVVEPRRLGAG